MKKQSVPIVYMAVGNCRNDYQQNNTTFQKLVQSNPKNKDLKQLHIHIDPEYDKIEALPNYLKKAKVIKKLKRAIVYKKDRITVLIIRDSLVSCYDETCYRDILFKHRLRFEVKDSFWERIKNTIEEVTQKNGFFCFLNAALSGGGGMPTFRPANYGREDHRFKKFKSLAGLFDKNKIKKKQGNLFVVERTFEQCENRKRCSSCKHCENLEKAWSLFRKDYSYNSSGFSFRPPIVKIEFRIQYDDVNQVLPYLSLCCLLKPSCSEGECLQHFPEIGWIFWNIKNHKNFIIMESHPKSSKSTIYYFLENRADFSKKLNRNQHNYEKVVSSSNSTEDKLELSPTNEIKEKE